MLYQAQLAIRLEFDTPVVVNNFITSACIEYMNTYQLFYNVEGSKQIGCKGRKLNTFFKSKGSVTKKIAGII